VSETVDGPAAQATREGTGCPVLHHDFSRPMPACGYLRLADELREGSPVYFNQFEQGYWVFTRHDAVQEMYKRPEIFSSESITPWEPEPAYRFIPTQLDAPEHLKYRRIVNPWFSPARVDAVQDMVRDVCRKYIDDVAPKGGCDLVTTFALQYPTEVFLTMVGANPELTDDFVVWVEDFFRGFGGDPAGAEGMLAALASIRSSWESALEERRGEPEPREADLTSHLMHATVDDRPLTDTEILDMLVVLTLAGLDTTRGTLGYIFWHLAEHPEDRRRLIEQPDVIPYFVEEATRYYTIIFGDGRKVTRDIEFHGASLKKGEMVYGLVAGANRDPRFWERGDEFVLDRKKNNHFGFAGGPHRCLGMHLARRELAVAVEEWLKVIPDFHVATDEELMERGGGNMTGLLALPLAWEPVT
jgi:cytochrome P450